MTPVIPRLLYRTQRPGYPANEVGAASVADLVEQARQLKIRSILCLLAEDQLRFYAGIKGGLLKFYEAAGFVVIPRPVLDHLEPPVPNEVLVQTYSDFLSAEKPLLVHCSAGFDRTGAVIRFLKDKDAQGFRNKVEDYSKQFHSGRRPGHFDRVTSLAIQLYDLLEPKHRLHPRYRSVLWAAAKLHDIGTDLKLSEGPCSHAWRSADKILDDAIACELASAPEITAVASLHRLEGGPESQPLGLVYPRTLSALGARAISQELVTLAAILRVADGLDRYPPAEITEFRLQRDVIVVCGTGAGFPNSLKQAIQKSALLTDTLGVRVECG